MPVALLLLLLGEGRRREPRRLAAEVPIALLLLEEGRRHEPRGLAAKVPLVLLLLLRGGQRQTRELAAEVRRLFCCCWERDDDAAPGGRFCMAKYAAISPVFAGTAKSDALPARPPVSAMPTPAHIVQCGCSRRLAAVVLPRHSSGGQRPKG